MNNQQLEAFLKYSNEKGIAIIISEEVCLYYKDAIKEQADKIILACLYKKDAGYGPAEVDRAALGALSTDCEKAIHENKKLIVIYQTGLQEEELFNVCSSSLHEKLNTLFKNYPSKEAINTMTHCMNSFRV